MEKADKSRSNLDTVSWVSQSCYVCTGERESVLPCNIAASFHCFAGVKIVRNRPKPKEKWIFVDKRQRHEASNRVVRGSKQVPVYEMRKRKTNT